MPAPFESVMRPLMLPADCSRTSNPEVIRPPVAVMRAPKSIRLAVFRP